MKLLLALLLILHPISFLLAAEATTKATERNMPRYLRVTGQLKGAQEALVAANATGKVLSTTVERGSLVKAGEVIAKLDDRMTELALQEAEANVALSKARLAQAHNDWARNEPLAKAKAIAAADFQKLTTEQSAIQASLAAMIAKRDTAKKMLEDATIRAPFAGMVVERVVTTGEYVRPDSVVIKLVQVDKLRLVINVPEPSVGRIAMGQTVEFNVAAFPGETFSGSVKFIGPSVRESTRDLIVEAEVTNTENKLKPGLFAEGRMILGEETSVAIPDTAIRMEGSNRKVFLVQKDQLVETLVEAGETKDGWVEIRRGMKAGDEVVTKPSPEAADGAAVK